MRILLFILLPSLLLLPSDEVFGSSHGIEGYSETGCTCHGSNAGSDTFVEIIGIPENFTHGERYDLTIILSGGPPEAEQGHRGGFNLKASDGELVSKDSTTYVTEDGEITHEHSGANQRTWLIEWIAPYKENDVQFTIAGNVVDGDHQPTDGDDWAIANYVSYGSELEFSDRLSQYSTLLILIFLFGFPIALLLKIKK
jgi:hypothetical protein